MVKAAENWYGHDLARIRADLSRCRHRDALMQTLVRSAGIEVAGHEFSPPPANGSVATWCGRQERQSCAPDGGTPIAQAPAVAKKPTYSRRRPEQSALHQVVRDNLRTLYVAIEQGLATALPGFVRDELEGYVDCGVLSRGFAVLACPECSERIVVGFSCKGLGFCPSCLGRRMAETSANLVEHVLPNQAPLRQFVLTLPFEFRARLAYDGKLLGAVCHAFVDSVLTKQLAAISPASSSSDKGSR